MDSETPKKRNITDCKCLDCGETFKSNSLAIHLIKKHGYKNSEEYKLKHGLIKTEEELLSEGAVTCAICGKVSHDLAGHIFKSHGIKVQEYKDTHGTPIRSESYLKNQSERFSGENNPGFDHCGKLSPFSDNFIGKTKKEDAIKKSRESRKGSVDLPYE
jgi:predicted transcriptional regulator